MPFHKRGIDFDTGRIHQPLFNSLFIAIDDSRLYLDHPSVTSRFMNGGIVQIIVGDDIGQPTSSPPARGFRRYYLPKFLLQCRRIRSKLIRRKQRFTSFSNGSRQPAHKRLTAFLRPISHKERDQQSCFCVKGCPHPNLTLFVGFTTFFPQKTIIRPFGLPSIADPLKSVS